LFGGVGTNREARGFTVNEKVLATVFGWKEERGLLIGTRNVLRNLC
jgi:hypothetical protein